MRTFITLFLLSGLLFLYGCIPTTAQIQTATAKTDGLMVVVDELQQTIEVLVKDGVIESGKVDSVLEEIDKAQDDIVAVNEAIREKADEGAFEAARAGWEASKGFNPYYVYGLVALNLIEFLGIWNEKKKVDGLKKGVSHATGESSPEEAKRIFDTVKSDAKGLFGQPAI